MDTIKQSFYVAKRAKSTNFYNSASPFAKHKDVNKMEAYVDSAIAEYKLKPIPEDYVISFTWYPIIKTGNGEKAYDMVNYSSSIKMIEDWLKKKKIIIDDNEKYVVSHTTKKTVRNTEFETGFWVVMEATKREKDFDKNVIKMIKGEL